MNAKVFKVEHMKDNQDYFEILRKIKKKPKGLLNEN